MLRLLCMRCINKRPAIHWTCIGGRCKIAPVRETAHRGEAMSTARNFAEFKNRYGPLALITGASSGIGWGFAEELAERGLDLVLVARRENRLKELADQLQAKHGTHSHIVPLDLAREDAPQELLGRTRELDIGLVVSNAGFGFKGDHATISPQDLTDMIMVNCHTPMQLARGFTPRLRARRRGGIVFTSSVEGLIGCPCSAAYSASKALVSAFGEALWAELEPEGIDVLTLHPGATVSEATLKQGIDITRLADVKTGRDVARLTLEALRDGPAFHSSEHYRRKFEGLLAMPRRDALRAMRTAFEHVQKSVSQHSASTTQAQ